MNKFLKIITILLFVGLSSQTFAAGDYIWEAKFKKALPKAEAGDAKAQYAVGEMYEKGKGAVRDAEKAFEWYKKSADQDYAKAAYKVGHAYLNGKGVKKNYDNALRWFKKSAAQNYVRAEYYLGTMYENGQGVSEDYDEATKWYKRALAGGYASASDGIERVAKAKRDEQREARRAAQRRESKPAPKPKAKVKEKPKTTKERVLAGGWKKRNKAVEYLPSSVTYCKDKGPRVECLSSDVSRNIGMADINYTTKAILFAFKNDGSFKVSYRNNVSKIKVTDPDFEESGGKVPVTLGWQDAEHKLTCELENDREMSCTKNKLRNMKFKR